MTISAANAAADTPKPGSPEWQRLMTASKVAAVLGLSPWESPRSMWHKMRGDVPPDPESRPMRRGNMLENAVLDWWLADNPEWEEVSRQTPCLLDGEDWCFATPDMIVRHVDTREEMLVDAKTTSDDMSWGEEPPAYYIASSMWQLAMAPRIKRVCLATLFGSPFDLRSFYLDRDDELIGNLIDRCRAFYDSLSADEPPPLDDSVATYDAIRKLHPDIDREATVELTEDEARAFTLSKSQVETWEAEHRAAKSAVLDRMGNARVALHNGQVIARRQPNRHGVSLVAVAKLPESENVA